MTLQPLSFLYWREWASPILLGSSLAHPTILSATGPTASMLDTPSSLPSPGSAPPAFSAQDTLPKCLLDTGKSFQSVLFTTTPPACGIGPGIH